MKLAYAVVEMLYEALQRFGGLTGEYGLAIAKSRSGLEKEFLAFAEVKNNLVNKYGKDGFVRPEMPRYNEFVPEYEKLMNTMTDVEIYPVEDADFTPDKIYCETATANDYAIFEQFMVKKPEKPKEESDADAEGKV